MKTYFILTLLLLGFSAHAEVLNCRYQLGGAGEDYTVISPVNGEFKELKIEKDKAKDSVVFQMRSGARDKKAESYQLDVEFKFRSSRWDSREDFCQKKFTSTPRSFEAKMKLTDLKTKELIAYDTANSDHMRTPFLLKKFCVKGESTLVIDLYSSQLKSKLLNSQEEDVRAYAENFEFQKAATQAILNGKLNAREASFASIHCYYQNK